MLDIDRLNLKRLRGKILNVVGWRETHYLSICDASGATYLSIDVRKRLIWFVNICEEKDGTWGGERQIITRLLVLYKDKDCQSMSQSTFISSGNRT